MKTLLLEHIPDVEAPPVGAARSPRSKLRRPQIDRRKFIRIVGAAGAGTGMAFLGLLPPMRRALATHSPYSISDVCSNYNNTGACQGCDHCCSDVNTYWCASDDWHRHDSEVIGPDTVYYRLRLMSCTGNNAWRWTVSSCCGSPQRRNRRWRCSDGQRKVNDGNWLPTVCPKQIDTGTLC